MASIVQKLIKIYRGQIDKQEEKMSLFRESKLSAKKQQKIGEAFISLIAMICCSAQKLQVFTDKTIKDITDKFLQGIQENRNVKISKMKRIFGKYIQNQFSKDQELSNLKDQFQVQFDEDSFAHKQQSIVENSVLWESQQAQITQQFLAFLQQKQPVNQLNQSLNSSTSTKDSKIGNNLDLWSKDPHANKVMNYLNQLGAPQTQLSYLCQQMGWRLRYEEEMPDQFKFKVTAIVDFAFNKANEILRQNFVAKNKKTGRLVASYKILQRIYISFPQIWNLYSQKRSKKSLIVEANSQYNPIKLLKPEVISKIQPIQSKITQNSLNKDRQAYINSILNFKSQYNLLIQQIPNTFALVTDKIQAEGPGSRWKVKSTLTIKNKGKQDIYQEVAEDKNSKVAEQLIIKNLVKIIYTKYSEFILKMLMIKQKKSTRN